MEPSELLDQLAMNDITLTVEETHLIVRGDLSSITSEMDTAIRAYKLDLIELLQNPPNAPAPVPHDPPANDPEPPSYVKRCPACGGTNWGCVGSVPDGSELWGCLDCWLSDPRAAQCTRCKSEHIV